MSRLRDKLIKDMDAIPEEMLTGSNTKIQNGEILIGEEVTDKVKTVTW